MSMRASILNLFFAAATAVALLGASSAQAVPVDIAVNGDFETGDFTGWTLFPSAPGNIAIGAGNGSAFGGCVDNQVEATASVLKNANIGIGTVMPGQAITIQFDARGSFGVGGVAFAELFSELDGGGVSKSELLGGAPLPLNPDPNAWTTFIFNTVTGPNVDGGVTVQFAVITGAVTGSFATVCFDNLIVTVDGVAVPTEATTWGQIKTIGQ